MKKVFLILAVLTLGVVLFAKFRSRRAEEA